MITVYHLVDAVPAAFFGIVALWAAGSSLHWFQRTADVATILLLALLIPAHELVIQFGSETLSVAMGLRVWRRWSRRAAHSDTTDAPIHRPLQLSLRSLLLLTVVVSVTTAVLANTPSLGWVRWGQLIGSGLMAAIVVLVCVWLALGKTHWAIRLIAGIVFTIGTSAAMTLLEAGGNHLYDTMQYPQYASTYWQQQTIEAWWIRSVHWAKTIVIALSFICVWLYFAAAAGWFLPLMPAPVKPNLVTSTPQRTVRARWCVMGISLLVVSLPLYLLVLLMTPTPIPAVALPTPNGYDDLVAAGRMVRDAGVVNVLQWDQLSEKQSRQEIEKHQAALTRVHNALNGNCQFPFFDYSRLEENVALALFDLSLVMHFKMFQDQSGISLDERMLLVKDVLRLAHAESRACGTSSLIFFEDENAAVVTLWLHRNRLTAAQCIDLASTLWELEIHREPWENLAQRQRIIDENGGWQSHLEMILADWSGTYLKDGEQTRYWDRKVKSRLLILELGIRAYQLETGSLPESLSDLVPKFLPTIPDDPYGSGPLSYRLSNDSYTLYSVGYDQDDDGGRPTTYQADAWDGDLSTDYLFPNSQGPVPTSDGEMEADDDPVRTDAEIRDDKVAGLMTQ